MKKLTDARFNAHGARPLLSSHTHGVGPARNSTPPTIDQGFSSSQ
jgi:hypothetical protein